MLKMRWVRHVACMEEVRNVYLILVLRLFENSVLRRIFGPKRNKVTEEWRKLHNGELLHITRYQ
jgi:hypothetical protein